MDHTGILQIDCKIDSDELSVWIGGNESKLAFDLRAIILDSASYWVDAGEAELTENIQKQLLSIAADVDSILNPKAS